MKGVSKIRSVHIVTGNVPKDDDLKCNTTWRFHLNKNCLPKLNIAHTSIKLYNEGGLLQIDEAARKIELTAKNKVRLLDVYLDHEVPSGVYREEFSDYVSIQEELPRVYGVGQAGLPEDAPLLRKSQALQLQSYLFFFDRLLADYLSQLGNIRHLFALKKESDRAPAERHTYFQGDLNENNVANIQRLTRFGVAISQNIKEGDSFAVPVDRDALENAICEIEQRFNKTIAINYFNQCLNFQKIKPKVEVNQLAYKQLSEREALSTQFLRDFIGNQYQIEVRLDLTGFYYILYPDSTPNVALLSINHYETRNEAREAANLASFFAAWPENYYQINDQYAPGEKYSLTLSYQSVDYEQLLQELIESPEVYIDRRELFLNHLLSRFSERFADYAALVFQSLDEKSLEDKSSSIEDKSHFLSIYDEISRDRGKAYNYFKPSWGSSNVSGLERRVALMSGYGDGSRKSLCNIEVINKDLLNGISWKDWRTDKALIQSEHPFPSQESAITYANKLRNILQKDVSFNINLEASGLFSLSLIVEGVRFFFPDTDKELDTLNKAREKGEYIKSFFALEPRAENIKPSKFKFNYRLINAKGEKIWQNKTAYDNKTSAQKAKAGIIRKINSLYAKKELDIDLNLISLPEPESYLNLTAFETEIFTHPEKWTWTQAETKISSLDKNLTFSTLGQVKAHFLQEVDLSKQLLQVDTAFGWEMHTATKLILKSIRSFKDKGKVDTDWKLIKTRGGSKESYQIESISNDESVLNLLNENGALVAQSSVTEFSREELEKAIDELSGQFRRKRKPPNLTTHKDCWAFQIIDDKGAPIVDSYSAYLSQTEALDAWMEAMEIAGAAKQFIKDGGTPSNPDFLFFLQDYKGFFIGEQPETFERKDLRDSAIKKAAAICKKRKPFVAFEKLTPTFGFQLKIEDRNIILRTLKELDSEKIAKSQLLDFIPALLNPADLIREGSPKASILRNKKGIEVLIAESPFKNSDDTLKLLAELLAENTYRLKLFEEATRWRFIHFWESPKGQYEPVFRSVDDYADISIAESAYKKFLHGLKYGLKAKRAEKDQPKINAAFEPIEDAKASGESIQAYLDFYQSLFQTQKNATDNWVYDLKTEGKYCYQLIKKDQPHAYHRSWMKHTQGSSPSVSIDCPEDIVVEVDEIAPNLGEPCIDQYESTDALNYYFKEQRDACIRRDELCIKDVKYFRWLELCIPVPGIEELPTGKDGICKYHYVVKGSIRNELDDGPILISINGYDTAELATKAYQKQLWEIIDVVSSEDMEQIEKVICFKDCFDLKEDLCGRKQEFLVALHKDFMPIAFPEMRKTKMCQYLKSFPIRFHKKTAQYYFQLLDLDTIYAHSEYESKEKLIPLWNSWNCYDTYQEAYLEFKRLLDLLKDESNCRVTIRNNRYRVELFEVLLRSNSNYDSEDAAWGRSRSKDPKQDDLITPTDDQIGKGENPEEKCVSKGAELFLKQAQEKNAIIPTTNKESKPWTFSFMVVDSQYYVGEHQAWYTTKEEAEIGAAAYFTKVKEEITKELGKIENLEQGKKELEKHLLTIDDEAERDKVEQRLLKLLQLGHQYSHRINEDSECGSFLFELVDENYILAKSTIDFESISQRDEAIEHAKACIAQEGLHMVEHILLRPCPTDLRFFDDYSKQQKDEAESLLHGCSDCHCELEWIESIQQSQQESGLENQNEPSLDTISGTKINYIPLADAYSFWGTVILPSWLSRFKSAATRNLFENLLFKESPSHFALNILWLSPREMCEFETHYRFWLSWMQSKFESPGLDSSQPSSAKPALSDIGLITFCRNDDKYSFAEMGNGRIRLIDCLKSLNADPFCLEPTEDGVNNILNCKSAPCEDEQGETTASKKEKTPPSKKPGRSKNTTSKKKKKT